MNKLKTEAIVVNALPFRDYDCILTLFTPDEGLIKLFFKAAYSSKKGKGAGVTTPLTVVEAVYSKGRGDLYNLHEIEVLNHQLALRQNLATLDAACDMLKAIASTQQPGKAAPDLYLLLKAYLSKIPTALYPPAIAGSLRLKLLRYEGLLGMLSHCCACAATLHEAWIHESDAFCRPHAPPGSLFLATDERTQLEQLAFSRDFAQLAAIPLPPQLAAKISTLFEGSLH